MYRHGSRNLTSDDSSNTRTMTIGPPKSLTMGNSTNYSLNFHAKTILAQHNTLWGSRISENKKCIDLIMMEDEHLCPCLGVTWLGANEQQPAGSSDPVGNLKHSQGWRRRRMLFSLEEDGPSVEGKLPGVLGVEDPAHHLHHASGQPPPPPPPPAGVLLAAAGEEGPPPWQRQKHRCCFVVRPWLF